jgi:hypothetical protein
MGSAVVFHHVIFTARVSGVLVDQKMIVGQCPCYIFLCACIKYIYIHQIYTKYTSNMHQSTYDVPSFIVYIYLFIYMYYIYIVYI